MSNFSLALPPSSAKIIGMTLQVPQNLSNRLKEFALARGQSEQAVLEQILAEALLPSITRTWVGIGESGIGDLSERVDELLFAERQP